jgi:hypothetical protein
LLSCAVLHVNSLKSGHVDRFASISVSGAVTWALNVLFNARALLQ